MISPTQTMENTTEVEYISIYDKPKRGRGRPKTCTLTDEEKSREIVNQINVAITITIRITFYKSSAINKKMSEGRGALSTPPEKAPPFSEQKK